MSDFGDPLGTLLAIMLGFFLVLAAAALLIHLLWALALFPMAKRAGRDDAFLAWFPLLNYLFLGILCDRAVYFRTGRRWRLTAVLPILRGLILSCGGVLGILSGLAGQWGRIQRGFAPNCSLGLVLAGALLLGSVVVNAAALYQLYGDYAPGREVPYTILSVIFGRLGQGILLLTIRNRVPLSAAAAGGEPPGDPGRSSACRSPAGTTGWGPPPDRGGLE